jgi:mRNA interferase RelE/StbE
LAYRVEFDPAALKDLKRLDLPVQQRLVGFLKTRVGALDNPRDIGEALSGAALGNYLKYRVGNWPIICDIRDARIVVRVLRLGNRREVYR